GSGMACGTDWPLCKGDVLPPASGGVLWEHYAHRVVALLVALMTAGLAAVLLARRATPRLRWLGSGAVVLVIAQALLGRLTVVWELPMIIKTVHLAVSMAFFALLILITFALDFALDAGAGEPEPIALPGRGLVGVATVAVYVQIVVGAFVRHTGSGLACQ